MQTIAKPPETRTDTTVDDLHGRQIADPYRWLEDGASAETVAWTEAQNAYTRSVLGVLPGRADIHRRLSELLSIGWVSAPRVRGQRHFYLRREGDQNQPVLCLRDGVEGVERVLLDPNTASAQGVVALDWWYPSWDGGLLAYGYSTNGDEWSTLYVLDVDTGKLLPDRIERTRYASVVWLPDRSGFYYTRYPRVGDVQAGDENYFRKAFFHRLESDPSADPEIWVTELAKEDMLSLGGSPEGRYLLASVFKGWDRSSLYLCDLLRPERGFVPVAEGHDATFEGTIAGNSVYVRTNLNAPRYRLIRVDPQNPSQENWQEVLPEDPEAVLQWALPAGGNLLAWHLRHATSSLSVFGEEGTYRSSVDLPTLGSITALSGQWEDSHAFYTFESFALPPAVYRLDVQNGNTQQWAQVSAPVQTDDFVVEQTWYVSRDGTRISMFLVQRKDLPRDGRRPTLLSGYGGFNVSLTPSFISSIFLWLEHGGVYAVPNLRGGGEYGEEWHRAGMLDRKQNVFDDFVAAAEHLISEGYTSPERLTISGGSNGGLLMGAAFTQRPDLFRAVTCGVPLLDMLRYHRFLIARLWIPEYGSADDPDQFPFIYDYSPYHHVKEGMAYPAVLFHTAASDGRVDPMHARKMAALLQTRSHGGPVLLRVELQAGHGVGKPLAKTIEEQTDLWSFRFWQLDFYPYRA
ncbi:MAG TPA: prolyl oligopeptidase family serine peptidase [Chloroflexota bacterium]